MPPWSSRRRAISVAVRFRIEPVAPLSCGRYASARRGDRQPRPRVVKPPCGDPSHASGGGAVAAGAVDGRVARRARRHPELVALEDEHRPGQREQQHAAARASSRRRRAWPAAGSRGSRAPTPSARPRRGLDRGAQRSGLPVRVEELEARTRRRGARGRAPARGRQVDLADQEARRRRPRAAPPSAVADVRGVARVACSSAACSAVQRQRRTARAPAGRRAAPGPSAGGRARRGGSRRRRGRARSAARRRIAVAHLGVAPVQVGLLGVERVQVAARRRARRATRPGRRTRRPVVRRPVAATRRSSRGARGTTGARSRCGTARRRAAPQPARVRRGSISASSVGERAEARVDVGVVGDVVAAVGHRRRVDRREPERVDAEAARGGRAATRDAAQVAHPVAVGVLEGARVDLVDDRIGRDVHVQTAIARPARKPSDAAMPATTSLGTRGRW